MIGILAFLLFAMTVPVANWMIGNVGMCLPDGPCVIPVGFGLVAPSGVLVIGVAFVLRDIVHERLGLAWAAAAIGVGAVLSLMFAAPSLAAASVAAFIIAETLDLGVYAPLRKQNRPLAVLLSGAVGAFFDSAIFLYFAFGSLAFIEGQVLGKLWMSAVAALILWSYGRRKFA